MCLNPISIRSKAVDAKPGARQLVRCNKCEECLKENQREWIYRLESEEQTSQHSLFGTLTYSPRYVPFIEYGTGEIYTYEYGLKHKPLSDCEMSICPEDLQKYWKRVRKALNGVSLKHYTCMEYGDQFDRPHAHYAIFYDDVPPWMMESILEKSWYQGYVDFEPLCDSRIKYVTKYLKKGDAEAAPTALSLPPRSLKSHGLGVKKFFQDEKDFQFYYDQCVAYGDRTGDYRCVPEKERLMCVQSMDGTKLILPRYFRRKFYPHEDFLTEKIIEDDDRKFRKQQQKTLRKMQDLRIKGYNVDYETASYAVLPDCQSDRIKRDISEARLRKKGL